MADKPLPDIKTFLSDPAFQKDREFFFGMFDAYIEHKEAERKKKQDEENQNTNAFDRFFGGRK